MKQYVLTGTPGAGKTTLIAELRRRGHAVVDEAATAVIARDQAAGIPEPWEGAGFIEDVLAEQRERQEAAGGTEVCFFDRSPVCTLALSRYLGRPDGSALLAELERIRRDGIYEPTVFFLANLGYVEPTAARRISFEEALKFEEIHRHAYTELGYQLHEIAAGTPEERVAAILGATGATGQI